MTGPEAVARARSALGHSCRYQLGAGDARPDGPVPWNAHGGCDCSGFVLWCLGLPRFDGVRWWDTTAIAADARREFGDLFEAAPTLHARAGDLFVYGDRDRVQGHVGLVSETTQLPESWPLKVIHCSSGSYRRWGDAIQETPPDIWLHRADSVIARYRLFAGALA